VSIPLLDELENIHLLIDNIQKQTYTNFKVYFCVNQPDDWWDDPIKESICISNKKSLEVLNNIDSFENHIIDKSSKKKGWIGKHYGVGMARRIMMDRIAEEAENTDIILSLDADTKFNPNYFKSIAENFQTNINKVALAVPYYHPLTTDETINRLILRYEIYLRYYALNLWRIGSFYRFTAIGSAIALPVKSYKAIGGITPHKSGEDFYLLQKLRKYGELTYWNTENVFPEARYSDRVAFGTGPAMMKGKKGDWASYPIFNFQLFDEVKTTQHLYPKLFDDEIETPMDDFLKFIFAGKDVWNPLRKNFKKREQFVKACHHKIDALRIFQFLKYRQANSKHDDEKNLKHFLNSFYNDEVPININRFKFAESSITEINQIRDFFVEKENVFLKTKQ